MGVVDVRGRDERVQQRLDRGARRRGVDLAAGEVSDHVLVAHLVALEQRQHLLEPQRREVATRTSSRDRCPSPSPRSPGSRGRRDRRPCPWRRCCRRRSSRARGCRPAGARRTRPVRASYERPRAAVSSQSFGDRVDDSGGQRSSQPFTAWMFRSRRSAAVARSDVARAAELRERVLGGAASARGPRAERPHVGVERVEQHLVAAEDVAGELGARRARRDRRAAPWRRPPAGSRR